MQTAAPNLSPAALARDQRDVDRHAREGSEAAWHQLFSYYYPKVFRLVCSRLGETAAQDLAEAAFLRAHARVTAPAPPASPAGHHPDADGASPPADDPAERHAEPTVDPTVGHVILAAARDLLRHRLAGDAADPASEDGHPHPLGLVRPDYLDPHMRYALAALPLDARVALELRYVVGLTASEAAVILDTSPESLTALTHRAAHLLRAAAG